MDQPRKGYKPSPFRKGTRIHMDNNYNRPGSIVNNGTKGTRTLNSGWNNNMKEIKYWGCNGLHLYRNCPHNPNRKMAPLNMLQEASIVNDITNNIPIINASLEYQHEDHQSTILDVEGKILNTHVSILIDLGAILSYIAPRVVEQCKIFKEKQKYAWLV